jgi:hypothetical protein
VKTHILAKFQKRAVEKFCDAHGIDRGFYAVLLFQETGRLGESMIRAKNAGDQEIQIAIETKRY